MKTGNSHFHLSLPCYSIPDTEQFYCGEIGATKGRHDENWMDIDLYGHQITFIQVDRFNFSLPNYIFQGKILPVFHFGVIVPPPAWHDLYEQFRHHDMDIVTETTFLKGENGEHTSFFIEDPNQYLLEFKCFTNPDSIFKV